MHRSVPPPVPAYDEMYDAAGGVRPHYAAHADWLARQSAETLRLKRPEADSLFNRVGITFAVYGESDGNERLIPFDILPRVRSVQEWQRLAAGMRQRVLVRIADLNDRIQRDFLGHTA